jgi:hypothetical protein
MSVIRKLQVFATVILGIGVGAALAAHFSPNGRCDSSHSETASGLTDTSGVCASDYCGCFEDLSRSQVLTRVTSPASAPR